MVKENIYKRVLEEDEVIPLSYDREFKLVFGDVNHLERLNRVLQAIFNKKVEVIELLPNDIIEDNKKNKKNEVDLLCKLEGEYVSVEVNTNIDEEIVNRNIAFLSRILSKELNVGEEYSKISKYYQININTENFLGKHFEVCHLKGESSNKVVTDMLEIYYINVKYYAEMCYNKKGKGITDIDRVLGTIGTNKKSVLEMLSEDDIVLKEIGEIVEKYSRDDDLLYYYDRDEMFRNDVKRIYKKRITEEVTKEITDKVTKEVAKKNSLDVASRLLKLGIDIDTVSKATGISKEKLKKL